MGRLSNQMKRMNRIILAAFLVAFSICLNAQVSNINFDSPFHEFTGFNGGSFAFDVDPLNSTNNVGKISNIGGIWEGAGVEGSESVVLDSVKVITLKVYQTGTAANTVILKLIANGRQDIEVEQSCSGSGWSTLSFDFSQARISGTNTTINGDGIYSFMALLINGGTNTIGTYYIDDLDYPNYESANSLDVVYNDLVYADEFAQFGPIDTSSWFPEEVPPNTWGWFNGEEQHYTSRTDNVYSSNGTLKIVAKKETYNAYGLTKDYTSARLNSKFNFKYGRIDVRAKLPQGAGTWPAIWMLGTSYGNNWIPKTMSWPDCGEIDVMEHWGNKANVVHGSIHTISSNGATVNTETILRDSIFSDWRVYSMNWSPNQISFLVDGFLFYTYKPDVKNATTWPFDDPQFILLNVAMGGIFPIDPGFIESTMEIDYIRVYQNVNIGIEEENAQIDVSVYPNPTFGVVHIAHSQQIEKIEVINLSGLVFDVPFENNTINMNDLSSGIYFVNIYTDKGIVSKKVIKK